jgi:CubicO group peptidase (beta-lactamase class C family)
MDIKKIISANTIGRLNKAVTHVPFVKSVPIPEDLDTVRDVGDEVDPAAAGITQQAIADIEFSLEGLYKTQLHNMVGLCVRHSGKVIFNRALGMAVGDYRDKNGILATAHTPACLFSASKPISALLLWKLHELGELNMEDTIHKYIPAFHSHGKEDISLSDLVSHRAKVPSVELEHAYQLSDHDLVLNRLCNARPHDAKQAYHAITGGFIISEVIEKVTGEPISTSLDRYFRKPMKMKYFTYGLAKDAEDTPAQNHVSGLPLVYPLNAYARAVFGLDYAEVVEASNTATFREAVLPAGNMYATAEECSRFYQMLLDGGVYQDQEILHPDTVKEASTGGMLPVWDSTLKLPIRFSKTGMMLNGPALHLFGLRAPKAFGHLGFINILCWADPQRQTSVALLTTGKPFIGPHALNFIDVVNTIGNRLPRI